MTIRTTEMNEHGDEVEIIRTVAVPTEGRVAIVEGSIQDKLSRYKVEEKRVFVMDGNAFKMELIFFREDVGGASIYI